MAVPMSPVGTAARRLRLSCGVEPGPLTILGLGATSFHRALETDTTLVGDVNGDGTVNLADLHCLFWAAHALRDPLPGGPNIYLAYDLNSDGIANQVDAKAIPRKQESPVLPRYRCSSPQFASRRSGAHYGPPCGSAGLTFKRYCVGRRAHLAWKHRARG